MSYTVLNIARLKYESFQNYLSSISFYLTLVGINTLYIPVNKLRFQYSFYKLIQVWPSESN